MPPPGLQCAATHVPAAAAGLPPPCPQAAGAGAEEAGEEEPEEAPPEAPPTRVVTEVVTLTAALRSVLVEFEGRSDGRSLRTIVGQLAPRQLAVVGAGAGAAADMAAGWQLDLGRYDSTVYAPGWGEGRRGEEVAGSAEHSKRSVAVEM